MESDNCCHVNRKLLPIKVFYFFSLAATSALPPYLSLYMFNIGLNTSEVAVIYGLLPFVVFVVRPVFGAIADKYRKHKIILVLSCILMGVTHMFYLFAPYIGNNPPLMLVQLQCQGDEVSLNKTSIELLNNELMERKVDEHNRVCSLNCNISKSVQFCHATVIQSMDNTCMSNVTTTGTFTIDLNSDFLNVMKHGSDNIEAEWRNSTSTYTEATIGYEEVGSVTNVRSINSTRSLPYTYESMGYNHMTCDNSITQMLCSLSCEHNQQGRFGLKFWFTLLVSLVTQIFLNPVLSMSDGIAYANLGDKHEQWGKQRLWGTVGSILAAIGSGFLMDSYGTSSGMTIRFSYAFYLYGGLSLLTTIVAYFVYIPKDMHCQQVMKSMGSLLTIPDVVALLSISFCMGMLLGLNMVYLFIYMQELGAPRYLMGIILAQTNVVECPMLFFAGHVIRRIGHIPCFHIGMLAYGIKLLAYSFVTNPWFLILVEPLHAFSFALFYAAASSLASKIAPLGLSATMQGLLGGVYFGLAMGVGSLIGGLIYTSFGGAVMWQGFGTAGLALFILYIGVYHGILKKPWIERLPDPSEIQAEQEAAEGQSLNPGKLRGKLTSSSTA